MWEIGREAAAKKKEVVRAVSQAGDGKTRLQLRTLFEEELDRQGVPRDPIWVEQKLDELEWSPAERKIETVRRAGLVGATLGRMALSHGLPDAPAWMEPPEDATVWVSGRNTEKTAVDLDLDLDPDIDALLARALASTPRRAGTLLAVVDVWFSYDEVSPDDGRVIVRLGAERVGTLNSVASERFAATIESAADRGAKPRGCASLAKATHLRPPYLLVVQVPLPVPPLGTTV